MRISDWSSDVCSSDLRPILHQRRRRAEARAQRRRERARAARRFLPAAVEERLQRHAVANPERADALGAVDLVARDRDQITGVGDRHAAVRSEEHTSELQSLMRNSYAVFCLTKK